MRTITVRRKGYTRKNGVKVKPAVFKIKDKGAKGRGKKLIKIKRTGALTSLGYDAESSEAKRKKAIGKAVRKYGATATFRMLNAQAVFRKRTDHLESKFLADRDYVRDKYMPSRKSRRIKF